jgi:hypothetical protein
MPADPIQPVIENPPAGFDDTLAKYGITHAHQDIFHYGGYRYTNLQDAVAEARRHLKE